MRIPSPGTHLSAHVTRRSDFFDTNPFARSFIQYVRLLTLVAHFRYAGAAPAKAAAAPAAKAAAAPAAKAPEPEEEEDTGFSLFD